MNEYTTLKNDRTRLLSRDPYFAIANFVLYYAERGHTFTIQHTDVPGDNDSLCKPKTTDLLEIIRAVYEIESATFSIHNRDGNRAGYVVFMYPSENNCSPWESVADYGVTPTSEAWAKQWDAFLDRLA